MPDGSKQVTDVAVAPVRDVERLLWCANNALYDLCEALRSRPGIRLPSPQDMKILVAQAEQARWLVALGRAQ